MLCLAKVSLYNIHSKWMKCSTGVDGIAQCRFGISMVRVPESLDADYVCAWKTLECAPKFAQAR